MGNALFPYVISTHKLPADAIKHKEKLESMGFRLGTVFFK